MPKPTKRPTVLTVLREFFKARAKTANNGDMLVRWHDGLETQVNVSPLGGEPVPERRNTWADEMGREWHHLRTPHNSFSEPTFEDYELKFVLGEKAEAIGSTGWNWKKLRSSWVGFDFDSITGHAKGIGITQEELDRVRQAACDIDFVEVRRSTSGKGLHLYVFFDEDDEVCVPAGNHHEHSAIARAVLGLMSQEAGFDFTRAVDCCGGNMWLWSTKANKENGGLSLVKAATRTLNVLDLPPNWKDHVEVVTRKRGKVRVAGVADDILDTFEALASARRSIPLDDTHKAIIEALTGSGFTTMWVQDHHLLQTHTVALARVLEKERERLGLKGHFSTISGGNDPGTSNCFLFPLPKGAFQVYRFGLGIAESETWSQDNNGWTTCLFNTPPDLTMAAKSCGGVEQQNNRGFLFDTFEQAAIAAEMLGETITFPESLHNRPTTLKANKDGRLVVEVKRSEHDPKVRGWVEEKTKYYRVFNTRTEVKSPIDELNDFDNIVRALISPTDEDAGFVVRAGEGANWVRHPSSNVQKALIALGHAKAETEKIIGATILGGWKLVSLPFHPEYPGGRSWNLGAAQYKVEPAPLDYGETPQHPHWDMVLSHLGGDLNAALGESEWAKKNGVKTGRDYLLLWVASLLREPFEPLPYLFFYGEQNCGKSTLHEAIKDILVTRGVEKGDRALTNQGDFNGELANAVLCTVEETDLSVASTTAYNRLKDWVTSPYIGIHPKTKQVYTQRNTTHWIQCANDRRACPVFKYDTRIVVMWVPRIESEIAKHDLMSLLKAEAPHFMRTIMDLDLPDYSGRLRIPVIETYSKTRAAEDNRDPLSVFIDERSHHAPGQAVKFSEFYEKFIESLPKTEQHKWTKAAVSKALPDSFPIGGLGGENQRHIGNLSWTPCATSPDDEVFISYRGRLRLTKKEGDDSDE